MPVVLLERVPLPSLRSYASFSILLVACAVYFAHSTVTSFDGEHEADAQQFGYDTNESSESTMETVSESLTDPESKSNKTLSIDEYFIEFSAVILQEPWCVWVIVNMAYCCLIVYWKLIQRVVFGELRVSEHQVM